MEVNKVIRVPTGHILLVEGDEGKLECLSIGDYGKDVNLKCDAMGLTRDIEKVEHQKMLPLEQKWVITVSTQYGCSMGCAFCDVPKVGPGRNATKHDLVEQVMTGIQLHPEVEHCDRLNIHYARMGEPTWNPNVYWATVELIRTICYERGWRIHPVVSTMMPRRNKGLVQFLKDWMHLKNTLLLGEAGLQISVNTTDEQVRQRIFNGNALELASISDIMSLVQPPVGRKITLNFAVAGWPIDAERLARLFSPDRYIVKLTPMHKTEKAVTNGIKTEGDYTTFHPYQQIESDLKKAGFDVLVFIASAEEDSSRITCGNAILSGTRPA